jgi:Na+-driven multidrug efflux pump
MFFCIVYMVRNGFQFDFRLRSFKIYGDQLSRIIKIGLPTCVLNGVTSFSFLFITAIVNLVGGVSASAAVGAAGRFTNFAFMPTMAISASIAAMSAQNIGANRLDRAVQACRIGTIFSVGVTYTFFILVQLAPASILTVFGNDPQMIHDGITYLRSFSFDLLLIPFIFCINGLLMGGGHTMFTLINSLLTSVLLRAPVCYVFAVVFDWGLYGIGWGAPVASAGTLLLITGYMISGKWKHNVVNEKR